jgi:hypothetical protein
MHRPQRKISERNPAKVHQEHTRRDFADCHRRLFHQMYLLTSGMAERSGQQTGHQ